MPIFPFDNIFKAASKPHLKAMPDRVLWGYEHFLNLNAYDSTVSSRNSHRSFVISESSCPCTEGVSAARCNAPVQTQRTPPDGALPQGNGCGLGTLLFRHAAVTGARGQIQNLLLFLESSHQLW